MPNREAYLRFLESRGLSEGDVAPLLDADEKHNLLAIAPMLAGGAGTDPEVLARITGALGAFDLTVNDMLDQMHAGMSAAFDLPEGVFVGAYPIDAFDGETVSVPGGALVLLSEGTLQMVEATVTIATEQLSHPRRVAALREVVHAYVKDLRVPANAAFAGSWAQFDPARDRVAINLCTAAETFIILHEYGHITRGITNAGPEAELAADRWALSQIAMYAMRSGHATNPLLLGPMVAVGISYLVERFTADTGLTHPGSELRLAQVAVELGGSLGNHEREVAADLLRLVDDTVVAETGRPEDAVAGALLAGTDGLRAVLPFDVLADTVPRSASLRALLETMRTELPFVTAGDSGPAVTGLIGLTQSATAGVYLYELPDGQQMEMVLVPKGTFLRGPRKGPGFPGPDDAEVSPPSVDDATDHDFFIGRYPVLSRQFTAFRGQPDDSQLPAVAVSVGDAEAFCKWAGLTLPTERQWEKAARGTDGRLWPAGHRPATVGESPSGPAPATPEPGTASPYGAEHMVGNIWEITADWLESDRPMGAGRYRVVRGGSYRAPGLSTVLSRHRVSADFRQPDIGFRAILQVPDEAPPEPNWMDVVLAESVSPQTAAKPADAPDDPGAASSLFEACDGIDPKCVDTVRAVLATHPSAVSWRDDDGNTPLLRVAAKLPYFEVSFLMAVDLVEAGADIDAQNDFGSTALHMLAVRPQGYSLELADLLMERGAELGLRDQRGFTIRMVAERFAVMLGDGFLALLARHEHP